MATEATSSINDDTITTYANEQLERMEFKAKCEKLFLFLRENHLEVSIDLNGYISVCNASKGNLFLEERVPSDMTPHNKFLDSTILMAECRDANIEKDMETWL